MVLIKIEAPVSLSSIRAGRGCGWLPQPEGSLHLQLLQEILVVRHHHEGAVVVVEGGRQDFQVLDVEVVGGLVEHDEVGRLVAYHQAAE